MPYSQLLQEQIESLQPQVAEMQEFVAANSGSSASKEEQIKSLEHQKHVLQNDVSNLFLQVNSTT
jgi:peptidoglycan hydrolase CwlO-like protein